MYKHTKNIHSNKYIIKTYKETKKHKNIKNNYLLLGCIYFTCFLHDYVDIILRYTQISYLVLLFW